MRGRPPKPTKSLQLTGGYRQDRHGDRADPEPIEGAPPKPPGLTDRESEMWDWLSVQMDGMGLLHECDMPTFMVAVEAWEEFWTSRESVNEAGAVSVSANGGEYQHPNVSRKNKALERLRWAVSQLGLSPIARTRIRVETEKPVEAGKGRFFSKTG